MAILDKIEYGEQIALLLMPDFIESIFITSKCFSNLSGRVN